MASIFHIVPSAVWEEAQSEGVYRGDTLDAEGFIHFSTREQVLFVANTRYKGHPGLLLIEVDADKLTAPLKFEPPFEGAPPELGENALFPHLYGALNLDAVIAVHPFEPDEQGMFHLPC
jgi:uncharacterized protein (DUF952 family)